MDNTQGNGFESLGFTNDGSTTTWIQENTIVEGEPY